MQFGITYDYLCPFARNAVEAVLNGDYMMGRKLHLELLEFHTAMFIESNPVPVKTTQKRS